MLSMAVLRGRQAKRWCVAKKETDSPHAFSRLLVQSPSVNTAVMDSLENDRLLSAHAEQSGPKAFYRSPHIPLILPFEATSSRSVHDASVVPQEEIRIVLPFNTDNVPRLASMFV